MSTLVADQADVRSLTNELAEDLAWLEGHARREAQAPERAGELHLAAGLIRNVLAPYLEAQPAQPLHVAVVGGAGAGKSTVANMLCGAMVADSNPQAGFTRHPIAYVDADAQWTWPSTLGFLGQLQRLSRPESAHLDADVYQVRPIHPDGSQASLLDRFAVWDCPDMTTWDATEYIPRLTEVMALADVLVYVASDERYNDAIPTDYLRLLLQSGKMVIVCLVKMREADQAAFLAHFENEVIAKMPARPVAILTIPQLTREQLADPVRLANAYRIPLLNQVSVLGSLPEQTRRRNVQGALDYLKGRQRELLDVAKADLDAFATWRQLVYDGQIEFDARYRREFLTSAQFRRFDEALARLLQMLELPGVGRVLSSALYVLRTPYRIAKGIFQKTMVRPTAAGLPERRVLEEAMAGWIDHLNLEASRRSSTHPFWAYIARGFDGINQQARVRFEESVRGFQVGLGEEVERTARAIYEDLERNPAALNTLRTTKIGLEAAAIGGTVAAGGLNLLDLVLVPLAASAMDAVIELMGKTYVDRQREQTRARQEMMITQYVSGPMQDFLARWPVSGGSIYERLQLALQRFPQNLQQLEALVDARGS